jgi:hypothetical protein
VRRASARVVKTRVPISTLRLSKNDSATALSKQDPVRPIDGRMSSLVSVVRKSFDVYWLPRSFSHQRFDALTVDRQPTTAQLSADPRGPVAAVLGLDPPDQGGQVLVVGFPSLPRRFGGRPLVVALPALDRQNTAQPRYAVDGVMLGDEPVAAGQ